MKGLRGFLRQLRTRWLPGLAILVVLICGLLYWLLASQAGSRVLLSIVAQQLDGQARGVRGSILRGLDVDRLDMTVGETRIGIGALRLNVHWRALGRRLLHVRELSAGSVEIALSSNAAAGSGGSFAPPSLPVRLVVDRLALGEFHVLRDGRPLPAQVDDLSATFVAGNEGAQLHIAHLRLGSAAGQAQVSGRAELRGLAAPWPFSARLDVTARGAGPDSPLCQIVPQHGRFASAADHAAFAPACQIVLRADAAGSLERIQAKLEGAGAGLALQMAADLAPRAPGVLRSVRADVRLPDKSTLSAHLDAQAVAGRPDRERIVGAVSAHGLDLSPWLGDALPPAVVSAHLRLSAEVENLSQLRQAAIDLRFEEGARWNRQPLAGRVKARMDAAAPAQAGLLAGLRLHDLDVELALGQNRVRAQGEIGAAQGALTLAVRAPQLHAFWPGALGGADLKGTLSGTPAVHQGAFSASYTPDAPHPGVLGQSRVQVDIAFTGGWGKGPAGQAEAALTGWRGVFSRLTADSTGFIAAAERPVALSYLPAAVAPQWRWQVGQTVLGVTLPGKEKLSLAHQGSRGGLKRWESAGQADNLVITAAMVKQVIGAINPEAAINMNRASRRVNAAAAGQRRIALDALWNLTFDGRLAGRVRIARRDGDLLIPGDPPAPLGVKALALNLTATPVAANASRLDARLDLTAGKLGKVAGRAAALLAIDAKGGMALDPRQRIRVKLDADITDLAWASLFAGDAMEFGGQVKVNLDAQGTLAGKWSARGAIHGDKLRLVRIDEGMRLIDGTLSARLDDGLLMLDSLRFPASLRVMPAEWRTKEWITANPEAKGGYVEAAGQWNLIDGGGQLHLTLHRFPALQRSDRYAMVSGEVDLTAALPHIDIAGDLKADAGWFSLEILQGVPSLDDDVTVRRVGAAANTAATPLQARMNLKFDMGPRFYITGMGLDAGLLGAIQIRLNDGRLSGMGALRTRGGGIEAYGQKLRLRRGTLTFQSRLDNPLLDIEALRAGEQIEAGVKVSGTAQRPRIDLVSYPDVSDVEKLSWLLLGRGPDESGSDAALLLSLGTALLGGGPPFYKQFGLDDVGMRTGNLGSSGSILPDRTVAGDVNRDSDSQLATQFLVASKSFANGITLSVEQALAGSDTVGRASYLLTRGLSLDLKGGSVNGIALVYRTLFDD